MLRSMLLAFEGADAGFDAAELAADWAKRWEAQIGAVGIADQTVGGPAALPLGGADYKEAYNRDLAQRDREAIQAGLYQIQTRLENAGVRHHTAIRAGVPHREILAEAPSYDLIVMAKETMADPGVGESPRRTLYEVLRAAPRPVVAVPGGYPKRDRLLVAYDGSLQATRSLFALQLTGVSRLGEVHVLSIDSASEKAAAEQAAPAIEYLASHGVQAVLHPVASRSRTGKVILSEAERLDVGLIAMGAYSRNVLVEFFVGSATSSVLHKSPFPLFVFH